MRRITAVNGQVAVPAGGQDLGIAGLGGQVDAERYRACGRVPALRQAERVVRHRLVQHRAARPGVGDEHQMAQRLRERPLLVHLPGQRRRWQPPGSPGRVRPESFDGVPHRAEVVGVLPFAELHPLRVPPVVVPSRKVPAAANPQTSLDAGHGVQAQDFANLQRTMVLF